VFDTVFERWRSREWKRLSFFGTAIRRSTYLDGRHRERRLRPVLPGAPVRHARRAPARGRTLRRGARVHIADDEITEHHEHTSDFARGECVLRAERDSVFCEGYFGWAPLWGKPGALPVRRRAPVVRALAAAAAMRSPAGGGRSVDRA